MISAHEEGREPGTAAWLGGAEQDCFVVKDKGIVHIHAHTQTNKKYKHTEISNRKRFGQIEPSAKLLDCFLARRKRRGFSPRAAARHSQSAKVPTEFCQKYQNNPSHLITSITRRVATSLIRIPLVWGTVGSFGLLCTPGMGHWEGNRTPPYPHF